MRPIKIRLAPGNRPLVATLTGHYRVGLMQGVSDLQGLGACDILRNSHRPFDAEVAVSSFLNSPHSHVTQDVLEELARVTTAELQAIVRSAPQLHAQAGKKSLFQIVLVEYEPASKKVIVGNVQTRLTENLEVVPYSSVLKRYIPDNLTPGILGFGETDFIRGLYSSVGRGAVSEGTRTFFANRKPISEISADEAVEVATSVIDASAANEQTLGIIPARISPPIDVVTVGAWGVKKIRWK